MKYTVFIDDGDLGLEYLGVLTKREIEDMLTISKLFRTAAIRREDLTVVAGEIVELW